ncbi:hypothetical protein M0P65_06990 [Candidatus Gracilibacteria bacterium]|jgi:hypothetical protein|nr:hypothetical protein [Candidatus Gracilibacteria bacterium]
MKNFEPYLSDLTKLTSKEESFIRKIFSSIELDEILYSKENNSLKEELQNFNNLVAALSSEVGKGKEKVKKEIDNFSKKIEKLKKTKSEIASQLTTNISAGGTGEDLYIDLFKINNQIRDIEEVERTFKRNIEYPATTKTKKLGNEIFDTGIKIYKKKAIIRKKNEDIHMKIYFLKKLLDLVDSKNKAIEKHNIENAMGKAYIHCNPDSSFLPWQEIEKIVNEEIEKRCNNAGSL